MIWGKTTNCQNGPKIKIGHNTSLNNKLFNFTTIPTYCAKITSVNNQAINT